MAARKAFSGWSAATAYNRGQVLYRLAETMETRHAALARVCSGRREVARAIDRVVWYAGWADKLAQVLPGPVGVEAGGRRRLQREGHRQQRTKHLLPLFARNVVAAPGAGVDLSRA